MPDLKERFGAADELDAPDVWAEAKRRAAAPSAPPRATREWPPGAARRAAVGALAFAVFAVAVAFAWDLATPDRGPAPRPPAAVDLAAELPAGWSELPAPPEVRSDAATAWTGSELLVWGGYEYVGVGNEDPANDGFVFDAGARQWRELPPSPLTGRSDAAYAWTGEELLVWGGWDGGFREPPYFDDGAAYDPAAETWRTLPPAPIGARPPFSVWTGRELIVWGSTERAARARDGAAYDPATNSWRRISDAPTDLTDGSAVWTGEEMVVFGAALDSNNHADTPTSIGIAYEAATDTWRELPPSDLSPQAMTASWVGDELIAWDYDHVTAAYDPGSDRWRSLPKVPLSFAECRPESVATPGLVFGNYCGLTAVFSSEKDAWSRESIDGLEREGCCRVLEPVAAGDVVLVPSHSYGMGLGTPDRRMFAYNPLATRGDLGKVLRPEPFLPRVIRDAAETRMPLVFPDGSTGVLVYPNDLDLESLGVHPSVSYVWQGNPPPRYPVVFLHDRNASIADHVDGTEPVGAVALDPPIEIWRMSKKSADLRRTPEGHWLRFRLPSWTVLVAIEKRTLAEEVAANLTVHEADGGYPVVDTFGPVALSDEAGEGEGPMLALGSTLEPTVFLWIEACSASASPETSPCLADGRVSANLYGDRDFVNRARENLRIEGFRPPPADFTPVPFVPDVDVAGGLTSATLTFPDGGDLTLVYPTTYGLVEHGVQPDAAYESPRTGLVPIMFVHGPPGVERRYLLGSEPELMVAGPVGPAIGLWRAIPLHESSIDPVYWLLHRRGDWTILVGVPSKAVAQDVADFLIPHVEARSGMPWIEPLGDFSLSRFAGEGGGTVLTIGDLEPSPRTQRYIADFANHATIELTPRACGRRIEERSLDVTGENVFGTLCRASGQVIVTINAERTFANGLLQDVRIESFRPAD